MDQIKVQKDLEFIKKIIDDSSSIITSNGLYYIIWGGASVLCTILTYIAIYLNLEYLILWIWVFFFTIGGILVFFVARNDRYTKNAIVGKIYAYVWIGILVFLGIFTFNALVIGKYSINFLLSVTAGILGLGYFITSAISKNKWLFILSFVWWAGCFPILLADEYYSPLILTSLVFVCEFIPGLLIVIRSKKAKSEKKMENE